MTGPSAWWLGRGPCAPRGDLLFLCARSASAAAGGPIDFAGSLPEAPATTARYHMDLRSSALANPLVRQQCRTMVGHGLGPRGCPLSPSPSPNGPSRVRCRVRGAAGPGGTPAASADMALIVPMRHGRSRRERLDGLTA